MNILRHVDLTRVFFIDIETVPGHATHAELPKAQQLLWKTFCEKRHADELAQGQSPEDLFRHGGLHAEFGRIVCISVGKFYKLPDETLEFKVKSFASDDECEALRGFARVLGEAKPYGTKLPTATTAREHEDPRRIGHFLCAHNGREFDYGFLGRRMLICGQPIPPLLDVAGYKPWDLPHLLDTMELWRFGDFKGAISLALLAGIFNIPSPKDDLDGAQVSHTYWSQQDLRRIVTYCEKDVITTARIFLHYLGLQVLWPEVQVTHMPWPAVPHMRVVA